VLGFAVHAAESGFDTWVPRRSFRHTHKNAVLDCKWNRNGYWLATCSRDSQIAVYDIRFMRELDPLRGHKKEVTSTLAFRRPRWEVRRGIDCWSTT